MDKASFEQSVARMRTRAAVSPIGQTFSRMQMASRSHGFVYPDGMPPCSVCGEDANRGAHVNPPRTGGSLSPFERRIVSAAVTLHRSHAYTTGYLGFGSQVPCQACGGTMSASAHTPGLPVGAATGPVPGAVPTGTGTHQVAGELAGELAGGATGGTPTPVGGSFFVVDGVTKTLISTQATVTRELAQEWETAAQKNPHFTWVEGAYVEAETPNRNAAMWSSDDLAAGEGTVANGPLNWLHEERHVIGTIAAARLVPATDTAKAHIRSLAAVWSFLYPQESRQVAAASDERKLWYSMECISREVACLHDGCEHRQSYGDYMREKTKRCPHVIEGGPRRFVDPQFLGGALILGAVRPGWAGAHAEVLRQAAADLSGRDQALLVDLTEEEQVHTLAQIIDYAA